MGYDTAIQNTRRAEGGRRLVHRQCITAYEIDAHLKNSQFIESLDIPDYSAIREKPFPTLTQKIRERGSVSMISSAENPVRMRAQGPGPVGSAGT